MYTLWKKKKKTNANPKAATSVDISHSAELEGKNLTFIHAEIYHIFGQDFISL